MAGETKHVVIVDINLFRLRKEFIGCYSIYVRKRNRMTIKIFYIASLNTYMIRIGDIIKRIDSIDCETEKPYAKIIGFGQLCNGRVSVETEETIEKSLGDADMLTDVFVKHNYLKNQTELPKVLANMVGGYLDVENFVTWSKNTATSYYELLKCDIRGVPYKREKWPHCQTGKDGKRTSECVYDCIHE